MQPKTGYLASQPFFLKLMILFLIIGSASFLMILVSLVAVSVIWQAPYLTDSAASQAFQLSNINASIVMQICAALGMFVIPPLVWSWFYTRHPFAYFKQAKKKHLPLFGLLVLILLFSGIFTDVLIRINEAIPLPEALRAAFDDLQANSEELLRRFLDFKTIGQFFAVFFMMAILPGIGEELLFRGTIQRLLSDTTGNPFFAILFTGILFGLIHMQFNNLLAITFMGVVLGYVYYWSGNIWYPIALHFLNNAIQVVWSGLYALGTVSMRPEDFENIPLYISLSAGLLMLGCLYLFKNQAKSEQGFGS